MTAYDPAKFAKDAWVQIADRATLEEFRRTWGFHHKLTEEQLKYADQIAQVRESFMYHGGDVLYALRDVPGIWHERLLRAAN